MKKILKYTELGSKKWDELLYNMQGTVFSMTSSNIEFMMDYSFNPLENESFIMCIDNQPIGIAILCIEVYENKKTVSWAGRMCPAPFIVIDIDDRLQEKYMKELMKEIDSICIRKNINLIKYYIDPLVNPLNKNLEYNYLLKYDFLDNYALTQIIDLRKSERELFGEIRKGHKSNIKKGNKYEIEVYNQDNVTMQHLELYKSIYERDAGMVTRNSEKYKHYYSFIKERRGYIAFAKNDKEYIAVMIVTCYKNTAYYSSYAEISEKAVVIPPGHIMQWNIISRLKKDGIEFYNIGEQCFGDTMSKKATEKEVNISLYKRGFGGYTISSYSGIKNIS